MANFNATIATAQANTPPTKVKANVFFGRLRIFESTFTVPSGGIAIADTITWGNLPTGVRVLGWLSQLSYSAGAASSTLNVGDAGSAARHMAATSVASAGATTLISPSAGSYETTEDTKTLVSTVAGAALQAAQTVTLRVVYTLD